jgi:hypothetical protein
MAPEASHYAVLSNLPPLAPFWAQMFSDTVPKYLKLERATRWACDNHATVVTSSPQ